MKLFHVDTSNRFHWKKKFIVHIRKNSFVVVRRIASFYISVCLKEKTQRLYSGQLEEFCLGFTIFCFNFEI